MKIKEKDFWYLRISITVISIYDSNNNDDEKKNQ
jgi:hypothetical protein